jgi:hypothetical protein
VTVVEQYTQVLGCNGIEYEMRVTEGLLTFCQRLTEMQTAAGLDVTFDDGVVQQMAAVLEGEQACPQQEGSEYSIK